MSTTEIDGLRHRQSCYCSIDACKVFFGGGGALQAGRFRVSFPMGSLGFFHSFNPSRRTMALGSIQPLTEMITGDICWG